MQAETEASLHALKALEDAMPVLEEVQYKLVSFGATPVVCNPNVCAAVNAVNTVMLQAAVEHEGRFFVRPQ